MYDFMLFYAFKMAVAIAFLHENVVEAHYDRVYYIRLVTRNNLMSHKKLHKKIALVTKLFCLSLDLLDVMATWQTRDVFVK